MLPKSRDTNTPQSGGDLPADPLKRVRSEGCVLRRQPLVRNSPLPLTSCYRLEEVIGRGSFGCTVFAATDVLSGVRRVVKCVRKEEPDGIRLWRNEVRFLRTLDHPNILRLFEVFDESDAVYQVTETCHGGDLHQWLDRRLRRRHRHARKQIDGVFAPLPQQAQQQQLRQVQLAQSCIGSVVPGTPVGSAAAGSPRQEESCSAEAQQTVEAAVISGGHRSCGGLRGGAAAVGAAAAAATAAAAGLNPDAAGPAEPPRPLVREELAARLIAQLLCALRYLHGKGIAHCDIKLENLLLLNELEDSEAGDGQSSDEEEEELRQEEQQQQQQMLLLQQQHEQDAAALSRARRGLRGRSSIQLNAIGNSSSRQGVSTSSSANALTVVPMVLRRRRLLRDTADGGVEEPSNNSSCQSLVEGLSRRDATVKLADFGLARRIVKTKPPKCGSGICEGTLFYRSPWTIRGLTEGDARSDLWAVGVALFILLSGKPPFNGNDQHEVEKAISETPVSFGDPMWSNVSLQCLGFLRALLYNPILPLHLRGPPPPPPYSQPTPELMLKHPWIHQCVRKERRQGLMRAVSAPSMQRAFGTTGPSGCPAASVGAPPCPGRDAFGWGPCDAGPEADVPGDRALLTSMPSTWDSWRLAPPQRTPSEPHNILHTLQQGHSPPSGLADLMRTASDPPLLHSTSSRSNSGVGAARCCSTCTRWNCTFGCCVTQQQQSGPQPLRLCWGRAPLVGRGIDLQHLCPYHHQQQQRLQLQCQQEMQPTEEHPKPLGSPPPDMRLDRRGSPSTHEPQQPAQQGENRQSAQQREDLWACCAIRAAGVSSVSCITCGGAEPSTFSYEEVPGQGDAVSSGSASDDDAEMLQPHLRLSKATSALHGLESCAAATNAAAAAAAAAAGVAQAVRRDAVARVPERPRLPLENVPHLHLRFPPHIHSAPCPHGACAASGSIGKREECMEVDAETPRSPTCQTGGEQCTCCNTGGRCCIAVVDWLTAELFEARVPLLLQACAWIDFARLSPLQRALRSVVVKLMEEDSAMMLVRDVLWVLDPQQSGSVSRQCLLDSLKVVRDFLSLEFALQQPDETPDLSVVEQARDAHIGADPVRVVVSPVECDGSSPRTPIECESPSLAGSGSTDRGPASPLQSMLMFATASPGDLPPLSVLEPYYKVLQKALEPEPVATATFSESASPTNKGMALGSVPSEVSTATGDGLGRRCQLDEVIVCLDTDGSGGIEFDEFLTASMSRADFKDREPACRNLDGFVSANDLLSILHFDPRSDLQGVLQAQKQRANAAVDAYKSAVAAATESGGPPPPGSLLDESEFVTGRDEVGAVMRVPIGASYILKLEGVTAATVDLYVEVARELKAIQHRPSGLWTLDEFMKLL